MLVYDITNEKSFENIKNWIRNIEEVHSGPNINSSTYVLPIKSLYGIMYRFKIQTLLIQHASADVEKMVLGNKCDINDKRQVSKEMGEKVRSLTDAWSHIIFSKELFSCSHTVSSPCGEEWLAVLAVSGSPAQTHSETESREEKLVFLPL